MSSFIDTENGAVSYGSSRIQVMAIPESDSKLHDAKYENGVLTLEKMDYLQQPDVVVDLNKKVEKEITGTNGKSLLFNETDGGGAKFEGTDFRSYVGVHDGSENIPAKAQIYAIKNSTNTGVIIDVTEDKAFYNKGEVKPASERDTEDKEIAVKGDLKLLGDVKKILTLDGKKEQEGCNLQIPYKFAITDISQNTATITDYTVALNESGEGVSYKQYSMDIPGATLLTAGLMTAPDKLDIQTLKETTTTLQTKQTELETEVGKKLNVLTDAPDGGAYRLPYFTYIKENDENKITVANQTITLDNNKTQKEFTLDVNSAKDNKAGLMSGKDKGLVDDVRKILTLDGKHETEGWNLQIPYRFGAEIGTDSITVKDYTVALDESGKGIAYREYGMPVPGATSTTAGLMTAGDKVKLDKVGKVRELLAGDNIHTGTEQIRIPYFFDVNPEENVIKVTARGVSLNSQDQIVWEDTATERNTISIEGATHEKAGLMTKTDKINLDNHVNFNELKVDKLTGTYTNDQIYVHTSTGSEISVNLLKAKTTDTELAKNSVYTADVVNQFMEQVSADKIIPFTEDFIVMGTPVGGITQAQNLKGWSLKKIFTDMFNGPEPPPEE